MAKIQRLPGVAVQAKVLLHQLLEQGERIKDLTVVVTWDDASTDIYWSKQPITSLSHSAVMMLDEAQRQMRKP